MHRTGTFHMRMCASEMNARHWCGVVDVVSYLDFLLVMGQQIPHVRQQMSMPRGDAARSKHQTALLVGVLGAFEVREL